ncbi:MAG: dihydrolipoamide acetyltransferase family protein [Candidatus Brocadiia bacterium]|nr:dihydrolipoamide acetyltransferase family protein [Candidatus Brocadiia bacterium]
MYQITMPKLSDSMEEGKIIEWKVAEGDEVRMGVVLADIESDKATMELECFQDGVIAEIVHGDGAEVAVGEVIGRIAEEGEEAGAPAEETEPEPEKPEAVAHDIVEAPPAAEAEPAAEPAAPPVRVEGERGEGQRLALSPYARKLAEQKGVDYRTVQGTGPDGRIVAGDIEAAAAKAPGAAAKPTEGAEPRESEPAPVAPSMPDEELPAIEVREGEAEVERAPYRHRTQARIVTAAKHAVPHFYMTRGAEVTGLLARKEELKERHGASVTHVVMLAAVQALKAHPEANRSYDRGNIIKWTGIHLGVAVDTGGGLTVAVLREAQDMALAEIAAKTRELVEKARAGGLSADERRYPTFTISNLGMFDVEHFEPIINPPSSMTLGVATALPTAVARGDAVGVGMVMRLTLSCDHRIVDGVTAARFLGTLKDLLESPEFYAEAAVDTDSH